MASGLAGHLLQSSGLNWECNLLQGLVDKGKTPFPKPAFVVSPTSTSIDFNGHSMGMALLNQKWGGTTELKPSSTQKDAFQEQK